MSFGDLSSDLNNSDKKQYINEIEESRELE